MRKLLHAPWRLQILILFLILIVLFTVSRFFSQRSAPSDQSQSFSVVPTSYPNQTDNQWKVYQTHQFRFKYPSGWKEEVYTAGNGEQTVIVRPAGSSNYYPSFSMSELKKSDATYIQTETQISKDFGLQQSVATVSGITGIQMGGTSSIQIINGAVVNKPAQETQTYLQKGDTLYIITYKYDGAGKNHAQEEVFAEMVKSIQFAN